MRRLFEPVAWLLFSGGGIVAAVLMPILIVLFGLAIPLGIVAPSHAGLSALFGNVLTRLVVLAVCFLALVHWAHRFRKTVEDGLKLKRFEVPIAVACYGLALAGTAWALYVVVGGG